MHSPESPNQKTGHHQGDLLPRQAESDQQLIDLWLHGRSRHTQRAYQTDAGRFMDAAQKPLHRITLGDLQAFATAISESGLRPATIHRILSAIKSLFAFGHRLGYLPFDVARTLHLPGKRDGLAERILDESEVHRILALEPVPRNRVLLLTLYAGGLRVSELTSLTWVNLQARDATGQITVFGKGSKTRAILIPESVWRAILSLKGDAADHAPVFRSCKGGHLDESQVWRLVRRAAERAGIDKDVSCHWLRHAHASHALDRGAPIHLVQATLGHASISTTGRYLHARPTDSSCRFLPI